MFHHRFYKRLFGIRFHVAEPSTGYTLRTQENDMSEIVNEAGQTIIRPGTDVVASMAEAFKDDLLTAINSSEGIVVIDLDGVEMVDSVGIGVIIASHNTLNQAERKLKVINVTKEVYGLFTTMRLNRRFTVEGVG
jgi:anti-sigma B factor antagonist